MVSIFLDLEMCSPDKKDRTGDEFCREIIEIGAVKLDEKGNETGDFCLYVEPEHCRITEYYSNLTGITNDMVAGGPHFHDAMEQFLEWCGADCTFYSWSNSDLSQVQKEAAWKEETDERILNIEQHWVDFQKEFGKLLGISKKIALKDAVGAIGEEFVGQQHDALWDARNTAAIYRLSLDQKEFNRVMKPLLDLFKPAKTGGATLGELLGIDLSGLL